MKIGDLEIHLVSDGLVHVDAGGPFGLVPRALYERTYSPQPDNTIPMSLTCMVVRSQGQTILIDTGLGEKLPDEARLRWQLERPEGGLVDQLARLGIAPEDVDLVIDTHLHADHCGGNTRESAKSIEPVFPRAAYIVQRIEWAEASQPNARTQGTYLADNFQPLWASGCLRLLHGDTSITEHVRCVVTPGHTRGHQCVLLESGDWTGVFLADLASYAVHLERLSWMTAYDVDPLETLRTKAIWRQWAAERNAWLFFEHDSGLPVGRLEPDGRGYRVVAEPQAAELTDRLPTRRPLPG